MRDPIVEDLRDGARKIWEQCNNDPDIFFEKVRHSQEQARVEGRQIVTRSPKRLKPAQSKP